MSRFKVAALAVALTGGIMALAPAEAQAQGWGGHHGYHHGYRHAPQPQYVHPKILRKQAEMQERVYRKYGYVQPQPHYGYVHPRHRGYGYGHSYGHVYHQPRVHSYSFSW
ncbi:MAG: hypothetical protein ACRCWF_01755 [Beijerinckiaceae bacterium]